jgi:RNA polymerase sigma factor (sigma-70 family)
MHQRNESTAETIARDYLRPLFAFSRRRSSRPDEAEELTGEILVEIYDSLSRGREIRDLSKWVWSIAHHTYAKRLNRNDLLSRAVGVPLEWVADSRSLGPEEELARRESIAEIRRMVAFLSEMHHRIVVLRYFRRRKIRDIATALGIPEGTVKWHLSEIRNGLRTEGADGMSTAGTHEVGALGCAPEGLSVGMSGSAPFGALPSDIVNTRLIPQNILLAAYAKRVTTQEIAKELGIPTPYLADEVRLLHDAELLSKPDDNHYTTDFIIQNNEMKREWYSIIEGVLPWYVEKTTGFFDSIRNEITDTVPQIVDIGFGAALWTLVPYAFDPHKILRPDLKDMFADLPRRKDGGTWIVMASHRESDDDEFSQRYQFTRMNGTMMRSAPGGESWALETIWTGFQTHRQHLVNARWPEVLSLIDRLIDSDFRSESLDGSEAELFAALCEAGIIEHQRGASRPGVLWVDLPQLESLKTLFTGYHVVLRDSVRRDYERFQHIVGKYAPSHLQSQVPPVAMLPARLISMFLLNELSQSGYLPALNARDKRRIMVILQGEHRWRA